MLSILLFDRTDNPESPRLSIAGPCVLQKRNGKYAGIRTISFLINNLYFVIITNLFLLNRFLFPPSFLCKLWRGSPLEAHIGFYRNRLVGRSFTFLLDCATSL